MTPDPFEDLFSVGQALARGSDPATSHEAAAFMDETGTTTKLENEVYTLLKSTGSRLTAPEIADALGHDKYSISPRLKPLEEKGLVRRDGTKQNPGERKRTAWVAN